MRVQLIKNDRIRSFDIPDVPSGNFWVTDYDESGKEVNLLNISAENGAWKLISNQEFYCVLRDDYTPSFDLKEYCFYSIKKASTDEVMLIYCAPSCDEKLVEYYINPNDNKIITLGMSQDNNIVFGILDNQHAKLVYEDGKYYLYAVSKRYGVYVNNLTGVWARLSSARFCSARFGSAWLGSARQRFLLSILCFGTVIHVVFYTKT